MFTGERVPDSDKLDDGKHEIARLPYSHKYRNVTFFTYFFKMKALKRVIQSLHESNMFRRGN